MVSEVPFPRGQWQTERKIERVQTDIQTRWQTHRLASRQERKKEKENVRNTPTEDIPKEGIRNRNFLVHFANTADKCILSIEKVNWAITHWQLAQSCWNGYFRLSCAVNSITTTVCTVEIINLSIYSPVKLSNITSFMLLCWRVNSALIVYYIGYLLQDVGLL